MLGELKKWPGSLDIGAGLWNICLRTHLLELTLRNWRYGLVDGAGVHDVMRVTLSIEMLILE